MGTEDFFGALIMVVLVTFGLALTVIGLRFIWALFWWAWNLV